MKFLRKLFPSRWTVIGSVAAIVLVPALVFYLLLSIPDLAVSTEWHHVLIVIGGTAAAVLVFLIFRYVTSPRETVSVNYNFKLNQPATPLGRYAFKLEVFYEVERRGEQRTVKQGTIEMKFKKADHPELLVWCRSQITEQIDRHRELAAERYPDAEIVASPPPTAAQITGGIEERGFRTPQPED